MIGLLSFSPGGVTVAAGKAGAVAEGKAGAVPGVNPDVKKGPFDIPKAAGANAMVTYLRVSHVFIIVQQLFSNFERVSYHHIN